MGVEKGYLKFIKYAFEMVIVFDYKGLVTYQNDKARKLLGYEESERILISDIFPEAFTVADNKVKYNEGVGFEPSNQTTYRKNKTCFDSSMRADYCAELNANIVMARDTTDEQYMEHKISQAGTQIESAETVKTQFVANVTHELRTPVNGIQGNIRNLIMTETDPERLATMKLIERGCSDMHSLINNILDYSKINAGKMELNPKEFILRDMMEYVKSNHINKIYDKGLDFVMDISADVPKKVIGDDLRVGQILNNLLSNATKFTSTGKITVEVVRTAKRGDDVELFFIVADTGIGISKENQSKLFKSFSQVEADTFRRFGGTGLGLNISKQLVEMMGGKIYVESEENKGSMFSFSIWLKNADVTGEVQSDEYVVYATQIPKAELLEDNSGLLEYGNEENIKEIRKKLSKLILCIEMKNWMKAEMFMEGIRQLTATAPAEVRSATLRLKMSVQKADYDKSIAAYGVLNEMING